MKIARMIGLAVIAALALTAWAGAGSASATVLCEVEPYEQEGELVCPQGDVYGVDVDAEDTLSAALVADSPAEANEGLVLESEDGDIVCSTSGFSAELDSDGTSTLGEGTTAFTLGKAEGSEGCATVGFPLSLCDVTGTAAQTPFGTDIAYGGTGSSGPNGSVTLAGFEVEIDLSCFLLGDLKCAYVAAGEGDLAVDLYNPGNSNAPTKAAGGKAVVAAEAEVEIGTGSAASCPDTATLKATYALNGDDASEGEVYVADEAGAEPTVLCGVEPEEAGGVLLCPEGEEIEEVRVGGELDGDMRLGTPDGEEACSDAAIWTDLLGGGEGEVIQFSWNAAACKMSGFPLNQCKSLDKVGNVPFDASLAYTSASSSGPNGEFFIEDALVEAVYDCYGSGEGQCQYEGDLEGAYHNPGTQSEDAVLTLTGELEWVDGYCGLWVSTDREFSATYVVEGEEGEDVYVTRG